MALDNSTDANASQARPLTELFSLAGRVAIITGGSKGIGLASARRLAEGGSDVALFDVDMAAAEVEAAKIAEEFGVRTLAAKVDVADVAAFQAAIQRVTAELGGLHIFLNNAGIFPQGDILGISDDDFDRVTGIDLRGAFLGARDAARAMIDGGQPGVIINMVSVSGIIAATNAAHYVAAKHAMNGATKAFARDLAPHNIRVLAIAPTLISTPGVNAGLAASPESRAALEAFIDRIPLGRAGTADEVARVVYFAATEMAGFMTGSALVVDGGQLAL